jgi:hypothetical protein
MPFRVHLAIAHRGSLIRCACGYHADRKVGHYAWVDGKSRFWAAEIDDVNCRRCLRARENYLLRRVTDFRSSGSADGSSREEPSNS